MLPKVPASHGLPLPRPLGFFRPADSWTWGQNLAHDTRCAADGKRPMSTPTSAISSWAAVTPTPVTSSSWATASSIVASKAAICSLSRSMLSSIIRKITAWWSVKNPRSASSSAAILTRSRRLASCASTLGSRCPPISASSIARPETPKMSLATELSLIWASSSSLLHPLQLASAVLDQRSTVAGQVAQLADRAGLHQRRPAHGPLGHLGQPDRIGLVGLGPPRHVLHLAGVDQPAVEPFGLQQVEDPLPVGRSRLHHHPGDPPAVQPVGQRQQRGGGRRIATDLLQPPARPGLMRHPHARLQRRLAQIQRRDPLDMQPLLVDLFHLTSLATRDGKV